MNWITAKFKGECVSCTRNIDEGERILYDYEEREARCSRCGERIEPTDGLGATDEEVADSLREDVIAAFKICNQQRARIADLESELASLKLSRTLVVTTPFPFLNSDFLTLMNDIGRLGHEKFQNDSFEVAGNKRRITRHRKEEIMAHAHRHLWSYEDGVKHDKTGNLQGHLGAVAFNAMLEFIFSQGE